MNNPEYLTWLIQKFIPNAKRDVPSIKQMKQLIINSMELDNFIKYQNGNLINDFSGPEAKITNENMEIYKKEKKPKLFLNLI